MECSIVLNNPQGDYREVPPSSDELWLPDGVAPLRSPTSTQRISLTSPVTRKYQSSTARRTSIHSSLVRGSRLHHSATRHYLPNRQQISPSSSSIRGTSTRMSYQHMADPRGMMDQRAMHSSYPVLGSYIPTMLDVRPHSSNSNIGKTSSLSGAIDIPPQLINPTLAPKEMRPSLSAHSHISWNDQNDMTISSSPFHHDHVTSVDQRHSSTIQPDMAFPHPVVQGTISPPYPATSEVPSNTSPFSDPFSNQIPFQSSRSSPESSLEEEIRTLRKKVKELELVNEHSRLRIKELERELARGSTAESSLCRSTNPTAPPPVHNTPNPSSIQSSWKARTEARVRLFCSLNRAGNALCSWHDSRRERRAYPPRLAPSGYLNCGCTYEEALFEESLSRHGVGSYHPGETVRMDPALRNPLLLILKKRYNYKDGDFERDPVTGNWTEGEGHLLWEQKLAAGALSARKPRTEDRR